ncbi:hypothetical protein [Pseudohaliea rubra]|uniref:hypothetical protein n=1 Tax=Pseudohaliea rubra TaxID=475795 RepID=UPI00055797FD|nr:hypothetical protein [Pseudohaliea rubra]
MKESTSTLTQDVAQQLALFFLQRSTSGWNDRKAIEAHAVGAGLEPVTLGLLATYTPCLCLKDPTASRNAQQQFHRAQLARAGGGTEAMKRGAALQSFLACQEESQA